MRALVTGATGFIGSHLAKRLVADGQEVHIIVRQHSVMDALDEIAPAVTVHYHNGTTEDIVNLIKAVQPTIVYHLASLFIAEHKAGDITSLVESNITFGTRLLEAMAQAGVDRLVNTGTSWQHWNNADYSPACLYAATKQAFEANIQYYVEAAGLKVVTLKLLDTYGPDDPRTKLIPSLLKLRDQKEPLAMSPGEQRLDLVYIDDVVEAFLLAGKRLAGGQVDGHEKHAVCSGSHVSMRGLVNSLESLVGKKLPIEWGVRPYRRREVMEPWDGQTLPGWTPKINLEEGLRRTIAAYDGVKEKKKGRPVRPVRLSFVAPCYNEAQNIEPLCRRIVKVCTDNPMIDYEVILVENGSNDGSAEIMRRLHTEDPSIKMLRLSRNFGYQGAITAGLQHATGEWVAVLDGDQQDPPELIPRFLDKALEGYDVVYGVRTKRRETMLKRSAYKLFYVVFRAIAEIEIPTDAGEFCIMHRRVVDIINAMPERQRFVRGLRAWSGFRQIGIPYARDARAAGYSKFTLNSMLGLGMDGMISFSVMPLRITLIIGFLTASASFLLGMAQGTLRVLDWIGIVHTTVIVLPPGLTQTNLLVTFLGGMTIFCLGVVGEYVGRIYQEVKQRPTFLVSEKLF